ncbi:MAG: VOC family protein [Planctomycetota bacterium]
MDLNHLHLHVRDVDRSREFYSTYFGFTFTLSHGDISFLSNEHLFDLALAPDPAPDPLPAWFHFGFRLDSADAVRGMREDMVTAGVAIAKELIAKDDYVSFTCEDPDHHKIEVYWEPRY